MFYNDAIACTRHCLMCDTVFALLILFDNIKRNIPDLTPGNFLRDII